MCTYRCLLPIETCLCVCSICCRWWGISDTVFPQATNKPCVTFIYFVHETQQTLWLGRGQRSQTKFNLFRPDGHYGILTSFQAGPHDNHTRTQLYTQVLVKLDHTWCGIIFWSSIWCLLDAMPELTYWVCWWTHGWRDQLTVSGSWHGDHSRAKLDHSLKDELRPVCQQRPPVVKWFTELVDRQITGLIAAAVRELTPIITGHCWASLCCQMCGCVWSHFDHLFQVLLISLGHWELPVGWDG